MPIKDFRRKLYLLLFCVVPVPMSNYGKIASLELHNLFKKNLRSQGSNFAMKLYYSKKRFCKLDLPNQGRSIQIQIFQFKILNIFNERIGFC